MILTRYIPLCVAVLLAAAPALAIDAQQIPAPLNTIESLAEDSYDAALAGHHSQVTQNAAILEKQWKDFRAQAKSDGATYGALNMMDYSVSEFSRLSGSSSDPLILARAANAVSS